MLPTVAGTPQAQEAVIENSIPQTATVPLKNGPTFTPSFDGPPQYVADRGHLALLRHQLVGAGDPGRARRLLRGHRRRLVHRDADHRPVGRSPRRVPTSIYTIPPSSPIYYVTYVRIYEATPTVVYVGYTPGYLGTVVAPCGTVVYGTGYAYSPWIGTVWYPPPYTYGVAAAPIYNPYVGYTFGFAMGLATAAWMEPYWGGAYYHPALLGRLSVLRLGERQRLRPLGQRGVFGHAQLVRRRRRRRHAPPAAATTTAHRHVGQHQRRPAVQRVDRQRDARLRPHGQHGAGGSGNVARAQQLQHVHGPALDGDRSVSGTGAGGSSYHRTGATTAGPQGDAHAGDGSTYNAKTGKTNTWGTASVGNNHYADVNGNVYTNTGSGWQQHSSSGWSSASGDTSWADRESQARSSGGDKWGGFSSSEADRFGGGGGDRWGGGGGFSGGGFGGGGGLRRRCGSAVAAGWGGRFGGGGGFGGAAGVSAAAGRLTLPARFGPTAIAAARWTRMPWRNLRASATVAGAARPLRATAGTSAHAPGSSAAAGRGRRRR